MSHLSMLVSLVSSQGIFHLVGRVALIAREPPDLHLLLLSHTIVYLYLILITVLVEGVEVDLVHLSEVLPQLVHAVKLGVADLALLLLRLLLDVHLGLQGGAVHRHIVAVLVPDWSR